MLKKHRPVRVRVCVCVYLVSNKLDYFVVGQIQSEVINDSGCFVA